MKKIKWTSAPAKKVKATHKAGAKRLTKGVTKAASGGKHC